MRLLFIASLLFVYPGVYAASSKIQRTLDFSVQVCRAWAETGEFAADDLAGPVEISRIEVRGKQIGVKHRMPVDDGHYLELEAIDRVGPQARFISTLYRSDGDPLSMMRLSSDCSVQVARQINYSAAGQALSIVFLDENFAPDGKPDWLNPPLVFLERDSPGRASPSNAKTLPPIRVGLVDSGVNYTVPLINRRLARDSDNRLIGYDFWDMDNLPYDAHPTRSEFFVRRHGTRTASLLLREAPGIELAPYRYPRPDMTRMKALVDHAASNQVAILGLPLGSDREEDWRAFEQAARAHPGILFIASAGNNGRDIDDDPVYPAALDLENMLVVTSADDFVRPAQRTNWGKNSVDYLIPAENVALIDYSGKEITASGTSYAVPRLTALAANLKMAHRDWTAADIIAELRRRYSDGSVLDWVGSGYIADPLAGHSVRFKQFPKLDIRRTNSSEGLQLPLDILVLDSTWTHQRIQRTVQTAYGLFEQCGILAGDVSIRSFEGKDYLRDLSTGSARTLLGEKNTQSVRVVLARNTRMQVPFTGEAFGIGNTRRRPWLTNSVWLMPDVEDEGLALAHELFHVLANDGAHVEGSGNLMQARTDSDSQTLSAEQCRKARDNGLANRLLDRG